MRVLRVLAIGLVSLLLLLSACAPREAPAPQAAVPPAPKAEAAAPAAAAPAKAAWEVEWEKALNEARREGKVVVISTSGSAVRDAMLQRFKEKFGIGVEFISGRGAEVSEKVMSEHRAGLYLIDVYMGGTTTVYNVLKPAGVLESVEPLLLLPEVKDPKVWLGGEIYYGDKEHTALAFIAYNAPPITINQKVVKAADEPKSYSDLLDPKWKGKIAMFDPVRAGIGLKWTGAVLGGYIPGVGIDYLRQLAKQEPVISGDHRQLGEWLAREKYAIAINLRSDVTEEFGRLGVPLKEIVPVEGIYATCGGGSIALVKGQPHPNAARVFVNWLLTRDGQYRFSKAMGYSSARLDVPTDHLDPVKVPDPKGKSYRADDEDFERKLAAYSKTIAEIFALPTAR